MGDQNSESSLYLQGCSLKTYYSDMHWHMHDCAKKIDQRDHTPNLTLAEGPVAKNYSTHLIIQDELLAY